MVTPEELNRLFIQTHHLHFKRALGRFSAFGLGEGQPKLLKRLADGDGLSQAELARRCSLEPATVTAGLNRMEKAGLVERRADDNDLRIYRIRLTGEGRKLNGTLDRVFLELSEESFAGFSPEEMESFAGYLLRMKENLVRSLPEAGGGV